MLKLLEGSISHKNCRKIFQVPNCFENCNQIQYIRNLTPWCPNSHTYIQAQTRGPKIHSGNAVPYLVRNYLDQVHTSIKALIERSYQKGPRWLWQPYPYQWSLWLAKFSLYLFNAQSYLYLDWNVAVPTFFLPKFSSKNNSSLRVKTFQLNFDQNLWLRRGIENLCPISFYGDFFIIFFGSF